MISTLTHSIFRSVLFGSFVFCCIFFSWPQVAVAQEPVEPESAEYVAAETFFPDSTKGFVVIRNLKELGDAWEKTQIGGLMNDPLMEAFQKDMQRSMNARMENKFGFTLDGIEKLPSGEVAAGMIAIPDKMPGFVVTMNVSDRRKETDDYLKRLSDKLTSVKVKKTTEKYKDTEIVRFTFPEAQQPAGAPTAKTSARPRNPQSETKLPPRQAFYTICMDHLLLSDQQHLIQLMIDRMTGEQTKNSLADMENFQRAMERCMEDVDGQSNPQIRWYIEPLEYGESVRTLMRGPVVEKRREKPSVFAVLKNVGFDAVKGIGGVVSIKAENKETVYRIFVYAQKPFRQAMKMLAFPDNTHFKPASWLPPDIVRCTTLYIDPLAIFDNFGPLFDNLIMQGEEGVWQDILTGLKEDENGPQIDLREEVLVHLGQRVMSMSKYQLPITPQSECIVVAVELKDGKEQNMVDALKKLFENDPEMQSTKHSTKHGEYVLWHRVPDEDVIQPFGGVTGAPDLMLGPPTTGPARPAVAEKDEEAPVFPSGAITVAKGCLFVGTQQDYLTEILDRLDQESLENISSDAEFKEVDQIFAGLGLTDKPHFLQFFARTDETVRPTYELIREGKMPQSKTLMGILANALFSPESDDDMPVVRQQAIDGTHLPEFDQVKKYFGPTGIYGMSTEDGFFIKGFLLEKKAEKTISEALSEDVKENDEEPKTVEKDEEPKKDEPEKKEPEAQEEPVEEAENSDDLEKTTEIQGKVTIDGKPAENVKIVFEPKDEEKATPEKGGGEK